MHTQHPNPTVHISESSPSAKHERAMLAPSPFLGGGYDPYQQPQQQQQQQNNFLSANTLPRGFKDRQFHHKRASSGSSIASGGPPSPLSQNNINPRIATSDATYSPHYDFDFSQAAHHTNAAKMPGTMIFPANFEAVDMRRIRSSGADDRASYAGHSVSSMSHNSPATPHTNYENEYDDQKMFAGGKTFAGMNFNSYSPGVGYPTAAYQQSLQDVFPDQAFQQNVVYPSQQQQQQQQQQQAQHRLSAPSNMMRDRLQAAQQGHLRTGSSVSRDKSPFKNTSAEYMPAPQRPQQMPQLHKERTSISPKELMLDEHDVDEPNYAPLFPSDNFAGRRNKSNLSSSYIPSSQDSVVVPQQYPFVSQQSQDNLNDTPDFPAHLVSMESTTEEAPSSQQSLTKVKREVSTKPVDTSSDSGTYSCTYHGCALRFDTPAKLQKHKREGHRQQSPTSQQSAKNSQAGPHKCERINPSTGKPCNSVFSRPYDLTRHEDTIHNARKLKVRCHLCTEEKTFSRNDALTRHMRVVHPDVDWVGKTRRKSQK